MKPFEPEELPPQDLDLLPLIPLIGKANRAIATLEGLFYGIPNPNILLSPLTTQEAVLSSKIEGTQADFEDVLKFEAGEPPAESSRRDDIQEIMNYRKALRLSEGLLQDKPFCLNSLLKLHEVTRIACGVTIKAAVVSEPSRTGSANRTVPLRKPILFRHPQFNCKTT